MASGNGGPPADARHIVPASRGEPLCIRLFGAMELTRDGRRLPAFSTRKARSVFCYLLVHSQRLHSRDVLMGTFWGDHPEPTARRLLRSELWRIRQVLAAHADAVELRVEEHTVGIDLHPDSRLDTSDFQEKLGAAARQPGEALTPAQARDLEDAMALYRGDLLEEVYDDWCVYERERLRALAMDGLFRVMCHHLHRQNWLAALNHGQRLLGADPLNEQVHAALMRCHFGSGNRAAALRQYAACAELLRRELDVEPMSATTALYEQIRSGAPASLHGNGNGMDPGHPHSVTAAAEEALRRVRSAESDLLRARRYLRRGLATLHSLASPADPGADRTAASPGHADGRLIRS